MKSLLVLALVLAPGIAGAQGYYGGGGPPPEPHGFHRRAGLLVDGGSLGLGYMRDDGGDITCNNCDIHPASVMGAGHIGGMLSNQLALMAEVQENAQTLNVNGFGDTTLVQSALMFAAQYWLIPQVWIKGGIGFAHLDVQDNFQGTITRADSGTAIMGAAGVELLSARFFALELEGRLIEGSYHGINDHVTAGTIGLGLNWF